MPEFLPNRGPAASAAEDARHRISGVADEVVGRRRAAEGQALLGEHGPGRVAGAAEALAVQAMAMRDDDGVALDGEGAGAAEASTSPHVIGS
jgi:hypothetical protein